MSNEKDLQRIIVELRKWNDFYRLERIKHLGHIKGLAEEVASLHEDIRCYQADL